MKVVRRSLMGSVLGAAVLVTLAVSSSSGQNVTLSKPFAPEWGMLSGWEVFAKKGCGKCHALRGFGGGIGPDLARIDTGKSFFEISAAIWNHLPRMAAKMREANIERPILTARELSHVIAFIFTAQYYDELGDRKKGEQLYAAKGCVKCHEVGGAGGRIGPGLDFLKRVNSPVMIAAAMWNHGPEMADAMQAKGVTRPTFQDHELLDLIAYIVSAAKPSDEGNVQVVPGTPERGETLFAEKQCQMCHRVASKGGKIGPELGQPRHHVSLTRFAALMWNHGPNMWVKMRERGIQVPRLSGQEMADIVAYLYTSRYFDQPGDPRRGLRALETDGCLGCHAIRGKGGNTGGDYATSTVVHTPAALVAAMWNHASLMESRAQQRQVQWPMLSGQELADIAAFFNTLPQPASTRLPKAK